MNDASQKRAQERLDRLIEKGRKVLASKQSYSYGMEAIDVTLFSGFVSQTRAFLVDMFGERSSRLKSFDRVVDQTSRLPEYPKKALGIIEGVKEDLLSGDLWSLQALVRAETFGELIDQARHLLDNDYKDAAAVIAGSVLEQHLRNLAVSNGIAIEQENKKGNLIPKKAESINADLVKEGVYNTIKQKQVTAWLGTRNAAAHGQYDQFSKIEVSQLIEGVLGFIESHQA